MHFCSLIVDFTSTAKKKKQPEHVLFLKFYSTHIYIYRKGKKKKDRGQTKQTNCKNNETNLDHQKMYPGEKNFVYQCESINSRIFF